MQRWKLSCEFKLPGMKSLGGHVAVSQAARDLEVHGNTLGSSTRDHESGCMERFFWS